MAASPLEGWSHVVLQNFFYGSSRHVALHTQRGLAGVGADEDHCGEPLNLNTWQRGSLVSVLMSIIVVAGFADVSFAEDDRGCGIADVSSKCNTLQKSS